ncbi:hypothetical protein [Priestia aryabhattai]|nr:hypothetical protein [Priestia aryabhattai]MBE5101618.1 hypothetical protein [Priestia aryabhattai]
MLRMGLVAFIFHEMDKRAGDVPMTIVERNEDQWGHNKLHAPDPKK